MAVERSIEFMKRQTNSIANVQPNIPSSAIPITGKNDVGRKVLVTSVGGALTAHHGKIVYGPYTFTYTAPSSADVNGKKYKESRLQATKFTSKPYWAVYLEEYGLCVNFVAQELTFV